MSVITIGLILLASSLLWNKLRKGNRLSRFDKIVGCCVIVSAVLQTIDFLASRNTWILQQTPINIPAEASWFLYAFIFFGILFLLRRRFHVFVSNIKRRIRDHLVSRYDSLLRDRLVTLENQLIVFIETKSEYPLDIFGAHVDQVATCFNLLVSEAGSLLGSEINMDEFRVNPHVMSQTRDAIGHMQSLAAKLLGAVKNYRRKVEDGKAK